jgi:hypothetical protein
LLQLPFVRLLHQCACRDRDGFLSEAERIQPLNTFYHRDVNGSSSSSSSDGSYSQDFSQQQGLAANLTGGLAGNFPGSPAGNMMPSQPGGPSQKPDMSQGLDSERVSSETGSPQGSEQLQEVFSKHAVRRSPRELQQVLKKKQLQKQDETNWEDDERYGWD